MDALMVSLTDEQRQVATLPADDVCIVHAGAGTGKTRAVIARAAHLIQTPDIIPTEILMVTFTNAATDEMRQRLECIDERLTEIRVATLHSTAYSLMGMIDPDAVLTRDTCIQRALTVLQDPTAHDTLSEHVSLRHIILDESQDNDDDQHAFVFHLARAFGAGVTVVGDERQALYGFRGGSVDGFRASEQVYRDHGYTTHVRHLSYNFRSSRNIVAAANAISAYRGTTAMVPCDGAVAGTLPVIVACESEKMERIRVCKMLSHRLQQGVSPSSFMLLCRTNEDCVRMAVICAAADIPVRRTMDPPSDESTVLLTTIHSAKGLERDIVFCTGMSDDHYPLSFECDPSDAASVRKATDDANAVLYVAITRAKSEFIGTWSFKNGATMVPLTRMITAEQLRRHWRRFGGAATYALEHERWGQSKRKKHVPNIAEIVCGSDDSVKAIDGNTKDNDTPLCGDEPVDTISFPTESLCAYLLGQPVAEAVDAFISASKFETMVSRERMRDLRRAMVQIKSRTSTATQIKAALIDVGTVDEWSRYCFTRSGPMGVRPRGGGIGQEIVETDARIVKDMVGEYHHVLTPRDRLVRCFGKTKMRLQHHWCLHRHPISGVAQAVTVCDNPADVVDTKLEGVLLVTVAMENHTKVMGCAVYSPTDRHLHQVAIDRAKVRRALINTVDEHREAVGV